MRVLLVQALAGGGFTLRTVESEDLDEPGKVAVRAELQTIGRDDKRMEAAVNRLSLEPGVSSVRWDVGEPVTEAFDW